MTAVLVVLLVAAALAPVLHRLWRRGAAPILALVLAGAFGWFLSAVPVVASGGAAEWARPWVPALGVEIAFRLDGLGLLFALLITGLGSLVVLYAGRDLHGHPHLGRFLLYLVGFAGAMLGLVLADDLITLFVFWELTSVTSYLLIGFDHADERARRAALQALLVTGGGALALLCGLLLLGAAAGGTFRVSEIALAADAIRAHDAYGAILALVLLGAFTKSAQVPFHFWLPNAMAGPTPVSAYLHSATMVKAGVYLLARLDPVLGGTPAWTATLTLVGVVTMLTGAVLAVAQTDLKRLLAYSTITALGTLVSLLGLGFVASLVAATVFLLVHALYKGALFLVAGTVDHETGTRDVRELSGLRRTMPWTATAAALAGLSMAGLPPLFGFIGKELSYKAKLGSEELGVVLVITAVLANALTFVAAGRVALEPFAGARGPRGREPRWSMRLGPVVLGAAGLVLGLAPAIVADPLIAPAVQAVAGEPVPVELQLWYGAGPALALSVVTVALGVAGYLARERLRRAGEHVDALFGGFDRAYDRALAALVASCVWLAARLQSGSLRAYLRRVVATLIVVVLASLVATGTVEIGAVRFDGVDLPALALAALLASAALVAATARSALAAVTALGAVGFGTSLLYVWLGAPDVALAQLLTETLIVLIVLRVLSRLRGARVRPKRGRASDAALAAAVGAVVTVLLLAVLHLPFDRSVSDQLARASVPEGKGRNVVNVILVDFRALDTLGEITVVAVAALGAWALLGGVRRKGAA